MLSTEEATALLGGPRREMPNSPQTPEEILKAMRIASDNFYREAIATNCHAFIEFTGLMNEYIKLCEENLRLGIDFTKSNAHCGDEVPLKMKPYHLDYMNMKIHCIFQNLRLVEIDENGCYR
jgi:hypothetical protein